MLLIFAGAAFAATLPTILVEKVNPQPVEPGRDLTIDITLYNRLSSDTGDFSVVLESGYPFILKSSTSDLSRVNLCGSCSKKNTYFLSLDSGAVSGTYPVFVKAFADNAQIRERIDVKVQGKPSIIFSTSTEGLSNITPDSQFSVVLDITNVGSGRAGQIKIQPDSPSFVVIGGSIKTLDTLNPNETKQAAFDFVVASSLEATSYSIPVKISYLDEQGNTLNSTQNLGVKVVSKGNINIQTVKVASSTGAAAVSAGQPFTVIARLKNVGPGDADFISAEMKCPFAEKKSFLGQLKKDEDAPVLFEMTSPSSGTFTCDINVFYKDDTGTHQLSDKFGVNVGAGSSPLGIILALLIIGGLVFFRKRILAPFQKGKGSVS